MTCLSGVRPLGRWFPGSQKSEGNSSANGGAVVIRKNLEGASEKSHAFAHTRDTHAEAGFLRRGIPVRNNHALPEINDFESDEGIFLPEADFCGGTAGVALNISEGFLDDAEEGGLHRLGQAIEMSQDEELGVNAAAVGESLGIFLESRNETKVVE